MTQAEELPFKDIREQITAKALELVSNRVRFRPYGRFPYEPRRIRGLDCIGVLMWVGQQVGVVGEFKEQPYAYPPSAESFDHIMPFMEPRNEPEEGCIVVLGRRDGSPSHCGLMHKAIDGSWAVIGIAPALHRPYVTMYPLSDCEGYPKTYYDYKGVA
jgi:hypothetical protein